MNSAELHKRSRLEIIALAIGFSLFIYLKLSAQPPSNELVLTNKDIIDMCNSGINQNVVKASISKSRINFDLSPTGLIQLKKSGISDEVLLTMINKASESDATAPKDTLLSLSPGIYYRSERGYKPVQPGVMNCAYTKGAFGALKRTLANLIKLNGLLISNGPHSGTLVENSKPFFLFVSDFALGHPDQFFLVRLNKAINSRQVSFQRISNVPGIIGIEDTSKVEFKSKTLREDIYEISVMHKLPEGEYTFLHKATSKYRTPAVRVFDFTISNSQTNP
ncbi:MAG TPA: hypothetical protein VKR32_15025 [Puia sp.]|nr:hypothetical protein [Puia sp.]